MRSTVSDLFYEKRYSHTEMVNPDFVALAQSMRVHAIRCDSIEDLPAKMEEFMSYDNDKPVLFDCRVVKVSSRECLSEAGTLAGLFKRAENAILTCFSLLRRMNTSCPWLRLVKRFIRWFFTRHL